MILSIILLFTAIILLTNVSYAATASISASTTSVNVGTSVTINASVNAGAWNLKLSGQGQNKGLVGQTNVADNQTASTSISFTPSSAGTYTFTLSGDITDFNTDKIETVNKTIIITATKPAEPTPKPDPTPTPTPPTTPAVQPKSSNANLSNLGIRPYDFSGFRAATTSYSVSVPKSVSSINVYAVAQHSAAKISGTGNKSLDIGKNTFNVTVTAEDGTKKTYTIYVTRKAEEEVVENKPETPEEQVDTKTALISALEVEEGKLVPDFNVEVKEYTLNISKEIEEVHIKVVPTNEKYEVKIEGDKELKLGENTAIVIITAVDGTTDKYTIKILKQDDKLLLKSLIVGYMDKNNKYISLPFYPSFKEDVLEYTIDNLEHTVETLKIDTEAQVENTTIEIIGNDKLEDGRNVITIKLKKTLENEESKETEYKLIVNRKKAKKTGFIGSIKNAFAGFTGGIGEFIKNNNDKIVFYSIASCAVIMFGLSIYLIYDYKRYKMMLAKIKTLTRENSSMKRRELDKVSEKEEIK